MKVRSLRVAVLRGPVIPLSMEVAPHLDFGPRFHVEGVVLVERPQAGDFLRGGFVGFRSEGEHIGSVRVLSEIADGLCRFPMALCRTARLAGRDVPLRG